MADAMVTYRYVRVGLVALVVFLLVSLGLTWIDSCAQGSISAFFYTRTHAVYIAALWAIGICLIAYKGSRTSEDALLNFSGFLAFVVALIPTGPVDLCQPWLPTVSDPFGAVPNNVVALFVAAGAGSAFYLGLNRRRPAQPPATAEPAECARAGGMWQLVATVLLRIERVLPAVLLAIVGAGGALLFWDWFLARAHVFAAVAMFGGIILVVVYHACYARAAGRCRRARFYATIAVLMVVTVAVVLVLLGNDVHFGVLIVELALIGLFGVFWAVQTWDVWTVTDKYPEQAVPELAAQRPT